ncbi:hypothetical protein ACQVRV_24280 (plasmid) [Ralstonia pseudosolanacearum]
MRTEMSNVKSFLSDKVANCDLVMVEIVESPQPQSFRARVKRVYTARKGVDAGSLGSELEFVGGPAHWGQASLAVGDTALVFLKAISGRLYEEAWRGHMVVEQIDGDAYAVFQHRELWLSQAVPASLRYCSRQDPNRSYASVVRLDVLETYLLALIEQMEMTLNTRLTTVAPDLVEFGAGLSAVQRKTVARVAAEWACRKSDAVSLLGEDRLQLMLQSAHTATQQDRQTLSGEMEDFDEKYFAIVDKYDGLDEAGEALQWFAKARATASLLYSLDSEDLLRFCEALYEAQAATDDLDGLRGLCRQ